MPRLPRMPGAEGTRPAGGGGEGTRPPGGGGGEARPPGGGDEPGRPRRRRRLRRCAGGALLLAGIVGLAVWISLPDTGGLATGWPERTAFMRAWLDGGGSTDQLRYRPVPLSSVPGSVRRAVLVSEDAAFYDHGGFDWHEIRAALEEAWAERRLPRGASTITQQLARNLYLSPARTPLRKLREGLIARRLERSLSKDRILELYLNVAEFGPGTYGVEAAARRYWGISISDVSPRQAAELAATLPSPRRANPATRPRDFLHRSELAYARAFTSRGEGDPVTDSMLPPSDSVMEAGMSTVDTTAGPGADTTAGGADTTRADTAGIRGDTVRTDTVRADTTRGDTVRADAGRVRGDTPRPGRRSAGPPPDDTLVGSTDRPAMRRRDRPMTRRATWGHGR